MKDKVDRFTFLCILRFVLYSMGESKDWILRENEKLLRRCSSLEHAKVLVPSLITDLESTDRVKILGDCEGHKLCKLLNVADTVYVIRSFFSRAEVEDLASEIVSTLIDSPPHANNLEPESPKTSSRNLWRDFVDDRLSKNTIKKLRWSCVGYHYDWGSRTYDKSKKSVFPLSFEKAYEKILRIIGEVTKSTLHLRGDPQSAIINFYHAHRVSDRLGGHRDDVESADRTPLVSISLGLSGLFLIDSEAILLRSGDVLVMVDNARQCLHAVPCILKNSVKYHSDGENHQSAEVSRFLSDTRISISIRQVF